MNNSVLQRNLDFMTALEETMKQEPDLNRAIALAVGQPAPAYYVEFATALTNVSRLISGKCSRIGNDLRNAMWAELAQRTLDVIRSASHKLSVSDALARVMNTGEASSFFISPRTARDIYYEHRRFTQRIRMIARSHVSHIA